MKPVHILWLAATLSIAALPAHAADQTVLPPEMPSSAVVNAAPAIPTTRITFIDSRIFDVELFKHLQADKETVEIDMAGRVSLSNIPARLDRWIAKAAEGGGKVEIQAAPATRLFIVSLISMAFTSMGIWEKFREENAYEQAKKYDVKILYKKEPTGDTIIEKIIMNKKKK